MNFDKWSIYKANLDPIVGSEQGISRPVLLISENEINDLINTVNALPITSRKINRRIYPNEALIEKGNFWLTDESIILSHQIRTLDKSRLTYKYGDINDVGKQNKIFDSICFQLSIEQ